MMPLTTLTKRDAYSVASTHTFILHQVLSYVLRKFFHSKDTTDLKPSTTISISPPTMNVPCGKNKEALLVFFTLKYGKWEQRCLPISQNPFLLSPPSFQRRLIPYDMASNEAFNNFFYNKLLDSVMDACSTAGI